MLACVRPVSEKLSSACIVEIAHMSACEAAAEAPGPAPKRPNKVSAEDRQAGHVSCLACIETGLCQSSTPHPAPVEFAYMSACEDSPDEAPLKKPKALSTEDRQACVSG